MTQPELLVNRRLLQNCLNWFQPDFQQSIVSLLGMHFPNYPLPRVVQSVLASGERIRQFIEKQSESVDMARFCTDQEAGNPEDLPLFKQIILRYRRWCAAHTEGLRSKTFDPELTETLDEEINILDAIVEADWFQKIEPLRLPRSKDFLPIQYLEQSSFSQLELGPRQYDEKFHILQAPALFLPDLAYFRAKCAVRDVPLTIAFLDIDDFKKFNTEHSETKVDRNLLPRFMQTVEAHLYHHGFGYRQGGDEYLILLPSLSKPLAIAFLDELRVKLAELRYPDIDGATTVSIGVCIANSDCPLTDRELRDRANHAKKFAKEHGKNCLATYEGSRFIPEELKVVRPENSQRTA
ncbi:MAG TPA: GGDEF domain-containing protein [Gemmataceae bacterium]|nr:GGDEF domain-containing protein [Gemmataceae bacterium]